MTHPMPPTDITGLVSALERIEDHLITARGMAAIKREPERREALQYALGVVEAERQAALSLTTGTASISPAGPAEEERWFTEINAKRALERPPAAPLSEAEKQQIRHQADDVFGGIYDPRPVTTPTDWSGNGLLNDED